MHNLCKEKFYFGELFTLLLWFICFGNHKIVTCKLLLMNSLQT